jgi:hypothetical protein
VAEVEVEVEEDVCGCEGEMIVADNLLFDLL